MPRRLVAPEIDMIRAIYGLIMKFNWTLQDVWNIPLPAFYVLYEEIEREIKMKRNS